MIAARNARTARAIAGCSASGRVVLLLTALSLALAVVIEVPHESSIRITPRQVARTAAAANSKLQRLVSSVEVDHASNASPRAESRRVLIASLMRNSKTLEEELVIAIRAHLAHNALNFPPIISIGQSDNFRR